ncbi:MAG TPA: isoamylase, partial [Petrotogaceae bacterium]|nr:isoamylase [Petrotogaceae bacterium]
MDNSSIKISRGHPKLGATVDPSGTNFAVFSRYGKRVFIELYENFYDDIPFFSFELDRIYNKTGDIWHIYLFGIGNNSYYLWRVDGDYEPLSGHRFNKNKVLLDPYAKAISGVYDFDDPSMYGYDISDDSNMDLSFSRTNSVRSACKNIVIDDTKFDWGQDVRPQIPVEDSIIYELHVRLFTMNTNSSVADRGTFDGIVEKIPHLLELGVTTLELMPIFEFNPGANVNINPLNGERLKDIWGYNPIGFFAVTGNYSHGLRLGEQVDQFKNFIKTIHKYGIEVILDVVYNHTGEGNEFGPTLSFRGLDNSIYYMLNNSNKRYYLNYSGTGNTLNCANPVVKELIIDSLRYWVTECHVDGFRFDLASILGRDSRGNWIGDLSLLKDIAEDPILYGTKLIAEGWDAAGGYYVGQFPYGWSEWNGKYRDTLRRFIRGDKGVVSDLATRICGSPDLFADNNRMPYSSVNFITAHDGFTLWDLVSYNR